MKCSNFYCTFSDWYACIDWRWCSVTFPMADDSLHEMMKWCSVQLHLQWFITVGIEWWRCLIAFAVADNNLHWMITVFYCICSGCYRFASIDDGVQLHSQWLILVCIDWWRCSIAFAMAVIGLHWLITVSYCICSGCYRFALIDDGVLLHLQCPTFKLNDEVFSCICSGWWQLSTIAIWKSECTNPTTGGETKEENISWFCIQFGKLNR